MILSSFVCEMLFYLRISLLFSRTKHPYIHANFALTKDSYERFGNLLYLSDFIYAMSPDGARNRKALNIAHGFSSNVIAERRRSHGNENGKDQLGPQDKLLPFIDILLQAKVFMNTLW